MAKKITTVRKNQATARALPSKRNSRLVYLFFTFVLILTTIAFIPALKASFVNWDDTDYVTENYLITNWTNLKELLTTPVQGNYHPLTMLSLTVNYMISGTDAWSYHIVNLLLHLVN